MSNAITVQGLGKSYRIDHLASRPAYATLRESVTDVARAAWGRIRGRPRRQSREEFWALHGVSFDVSEGTAVGVIGRNGAGKSTLLKILSRITEPTTGRARIHGRIGSLLEVGTGFHPELTGRENVYLNGAVLGMSRAEVRRKFDEIVAFSEVERFLDTPVKRYSSGMYVRLGFAVAAHLEPEILVVDEVLAVGDAAFQKKCLGKMSDASRGGRTVLFVSHNMAAVAQLCGSAIWLDEGRIRMSGPSDTVVKAYLTSSAHQQAERSWPEPDAAPGDERVRLLGCRVVQGGHVAPVVDINLPSRVELEFEVRQPARNLITGVSYYDAYNTCLFASCDWRPNRLAPGRYRKAMDVPAQLLAEGRISVLVQLVFYDPDVRSIILPDAMAFDAADSDHPLAVRGQYRGMWPGQLRVALPWGTEERLP
jgi:lipopolysaccharide transport system ATP-binding protein